jgi:hypothetical protein
MDVASGDWSGVVEMLREEFTSIGGQRRSMEESVISASIRGIRGPQQGNILALFECFALLPEDVQCPLPVLRMLFDAATAAKAEGTSGRSESVKQQPTILDIRRWLKVLLDRALVLGSVDKPSLHDIVGDFVIGQVPASELASGHRLLVESFRSKRPAFGWRGDSDDQVSKYIHFAIDVHVEGAGPSETVEAWLSDFDRGQDCIPLAAARSLGPARLSELAERAEKREAWWLASLYHNANGMVTVLQSGPQAAVGSFRLAHAALLHAKPSTACSEEDLVRHEVSVIQVRSFAQYFILLVILTRRCALRLYLKHGTQKICEMQSTCPVARYLVLRHICRARPRSS